VSEVITLIPEIVSTLSSLLVALAAGVGAFVAWSGLNSWKKQKLWEADNELAETIFYKIEAIRQRFKSTRVQSLLIRTPYNEEHHKRSEVGHHERAYFEKHSNALEVMTDDLSGPLRKAELLWGEQGLKPIREYLSSIDDFFLGFWIWIEKLEDCNKVNLKDYKNALAEADLIEETVFGRKNPILNFDELESFFEPNFEKDVLSSLSSASAFKTKMEVSFTEARTNLFDRMGRRP